MNQHTTAAVDAVLTAHAQGADVGEFIADVLARAAARLGSSEALLANRPGSWEAAAVAELLRGTVGHDDEELARYRGAGS
jgi:hypothetical protein